LARSGDETVVEGIREGNGAECKKANGAKRWHDCKIEEC
jgi:hypothetical protein